jgi:hypothetical protein
MVLQGWPFSYWQQRERTDAFSNQKEIKVWKEKRLLPFCGKKREKEEKTKQSKMY